MTNTEGPKTITLQLTQGAEPTAADLATFTAVRGVLWIAERDLGGYDEPTARIDLPGWDEAQAAINWDYAERVTILDFGRAPAVALTAKGMRVLAAVRAVTGLPVPEPF